MAGVDRVEEMRWPMVAGGDLIVPIGSCEQHGPHLPLATDTLIAVEVAGRAAARLDGCVVAPALAITASGEHQGFAGTLSIGTAVMEAVVVELVRSADWAERVILVNGHGGNHAAVTKAVARSLADGRRVLSWWPRADTTSSSDLHAGHAETSMVLAIAPHLVDLTVAEPGITLDRDGLERLRTHGVRAVSPNGVLGDPLGATPTAGERLLARLTDDLVDTIRSWTPA